MLLRFSLLLTLVFVSGCYPIEKIYVQTSDGPDGNQMFVTISKVKIDEASKTGAVLMNGDLPKGYFDKNLNEWIYSGERETSTVLQKLDGCVIVDESNWRCKTERGYLLEMLGGEIRWKDDEMEPFKAAYRLAFWPKKTF